MNILVIGAAGMMGTALCNRLKALRSGSDLSHPALHIEEIFEYGRSSTPEDLKRYCRDADFVFHLAGVCRPEDPEDFMRGNVYLAAEVLDILKQSQHPVPVMLSSSVQATLAGRFGDTAYGRSKLAAEELMFAYARETGAKVAVYRFPNIMGHSRPRYNSAVATFCWAIANDVAYTVNDRSTELELIYIEDLLDGMLDLLEGKEAHCTFNGLETVPDANGLYCYISATHKASLGQIVDLLLEFKQYRASEILAKYPDGSFARKLFCLYRSYLPTHLQKGENS